MTADKEVVDRAVAAIEAAIMRKGTERLQIELDECRRKLENIAKHPDTPPLIKQYAAGKLDHLPNKRARAWRSRPGRPRIEDRDKTIEARRPWEEKGMSRRTWYRRQAEERPD
jgi:hypothetical protein